MEASPPVKASASEQPKKDSHQPNETAKKDASLNKNKDASNIEKEDLKLFNSDKFWNDLFVDLNLREPPEPIKRKTLKERLAMLAVFGFIITFIFQVFYGMYIDYYYGFENINPQDTELVKDVMFGGEPWVLLCNWNTDKRWKMPENIRKSRFEILKYAKIGTINCSDELASGKRFNERFRIPPNTEGVVVANGKAPRFLTDWALQTRLNLISYIERQTRLDFRVVSEKSSFQRRCLLPQGTHCLAILGRKGISANDKNIHLQKLFGKIGAVRKMKYVIIDTEINSINYGKEISKPKRRFTATEVACIINTTPLPEEKKITVKC